MDKFLIYGTKPLFGTLDVPMAKNAILPILAGCILNSGEVEIENITYYSDVLVMTQILSHLGAQVKTVGDTLKIDAEAISNYDIPFSLTNKIRSSIFCLGPTLARFKKAKIAYPGGCAIGTRPIDIHLNGLKNLNVKITDRHGLLYCDSTNAKAGKVNLSFPSVGATENLLMFATTLKGTTILNNVAKEPEIVDLCNFLNVCGAKISGAGTDTIQIEGVKKLNSCRYQPISDRIIAGTYLIAAAITKGEIELVNSVPNNILAILDILKNLGCKIHINGDKIYLQSKNRLKAVRKIETLPYPGFPTDCQSQMASLLSVCKGNSVVMENLFENRFKYVQELNKLGANIVACGKSINISGVKNLYGAEVTGLDLRGGAALVLAGLAAEGYTKVSGVDLIDRGYYKLEEALTKVGADIKRINET